MRYVKLILVYLLSFPLLANNEEKPINNSSELKYWCKNKSAEHYLAKGITPYNWTESWWTEGEIIYVTGTWKINSNKQIVKCRVRKGVAEKYAILEFVDK